MFEVSDAGDDADHGLGAREEERAKMAALQPEVFEGKLEVNIEADCDFDEILEQNS